MSYVAVIWYGCPWGKSVWQSLGYQMNGRDYKWTWFGELFSDFMVISNDINFTYVIVFNQWHDPTECVYKLLQNHATQLNYCHFQACLVLLYRVWQFDFIRRFNGSLQAMSWGGGAMMLQFLAWTLNHCRTYACALVSCLYLCVYLIV